MQRASHSSFVAVVASLVLHGGLLWWLWSRPPAAPVVIPVAPLQLTFIEVAPKPEPAPEPPAVAPEQTPVMKNPKVSKPPVAAPVVENPEVAPPVSDRPVNDSPRALPSVTTLTLSPGSSFSISLDGGVAMIDSAPRGLHGFERAKDLVGETARDTIGRGKVDRGLVHPYYSQLGKALMKNWDADRVLKQGGLKAWTEQVGQNVKISNEIYLDKASEYGRTGNPLGDVKLPEQRTGPLNDRVGGIGAPDFAARKEMGRQMREAYKATRRATIRVVQDRQGKLVSVELIEPSRDQQVDREAMVDVRAAAEKLPVPPPEVVGARGQLASMWSFELIISISPPIPTFTFEFDEVSGFIDPRLPLDRRIYKKVRLISVE